MRKLKIAIKMAVERLALWMLRCVGTEIQVYPVHMELYRAEIETLCRAEALQTYSTDNVLGAGYFRGRRVMSMMKAKYPHLKVRDLWKAVDICSGSISSGR